MKLATMQVVQRPFQDLSQCTLNPLPWHVRPACGDRPLRWITVSDANDAYPKPTSPTWGWAAGYCKALQRDALYTPKLSNELVVRFTGSWTAVGMTHW